MRRMLVLSAIMLIIFFSSASIAQQSNASKAKVSIDESDPIAAVGHGAMLNANGKEIDATPEFVLKAQRFYLKRLYQQADKKQRSRFKRKEKRLMNGQTWNQQDQVTANSALIAWLINEVNPMNASHLVTKNTMLRIQFARHTKKRLPGQTIKADKIFASDALRKILDQEGLITLLSPTRSGGTEYINECRDAGVPIPPDWGSSQWDFRGELTNEFILEPKKAEVFVFESDEPRGVCIALPRSVGSTIEALGIICQGNDASKVCFWDNKFEPIPVGQDRPLEEFFGGVDLVGGNGVCTDCHAGENPFIVHPSTPLDLGAILQPNDFYDPLVYFDWPQNLGPTDVLDGISLNPDEGSCLTCHRQGVAGRYPPVSTLYPGYCGIPVLRTAIRQTMPPGGAGSTDYSKHINALIEACSEPPKPTSIWVDFAYTGRENGTSDAPFNTLAEGVDAISLRGQISIRQGSSSETIRITNPLTLQAVGGTVTIGL